MTDEYENLNLGLGIMSDIPRGTRPPTDNDNKGGHRRGPVIGGHWEQKRRGGHAGQERTESGT